MPDSTGVIVGYIAGDKLRHYRRELKSKKPSAVAICGRKLEDGEHWIENLNDAHAETRMDYPVCPGCEANFSS